MHAVVASDQTAYRDHSGSAADRVVPLQALTAAFPALNVAPGKPLSKPAKELLDLLPNQLDLDRLDDQRNRAKASLAGRAADDFDKHAKQLESRINTDMRLAETQTRRVERLGDDQEKLENQIAAARGEEFVMDEEAQAKKIEALEAALAKKVTQVTKARKDVDDAVKRIGEAKVTLESFLSGQGGLKDVLGAEAGRTKKPVSTSETPEQRDARLRSILKVK